MLKIVQDVVEEIKNPDLIVASYLSSQEEVYYDDPPAISSFLFLNVGEVLLVVVLVVVDVVLAAMFGLGSWQFLLTFVVADALFITLAVQRFKQKFTRYVITSSRIMRISGVLSRNSFSIPWSKVTDISFKQSIVMRYLDFANVRIESANEASGLQELRGLKNPLQFHRLMLEMVAAKQGHTTPESGDAPLAKFEADSEARKLARLRTAEPKPAPSPQKPRWRSGRRVAVRDQRGTTDEGSPVSAGVGADGGDDGTND